MKQVNIHKSRESILYKRVLSFLFVTMLFSYTHAQNDLPINAKKGSCYAKCLVERITDSFETVKDTLLIYTGTDFNIPFLKQYENNDIVRIERIEPYEEFEYIPNVIFKVTDTTLIKDFIKIIRYKMEYVKDSPSNQWVEVLCDAKITTSLIQKIQTVLIQEGFLKSYSNDFIFNNQTKKAMIEYQRKYHLPLGSLCLEMLDKMGIHY